MRIKAFDWLRGLAVIVMVQTHALALLADGPRSDRFFVWLQRIDGLVAPSFIFTAGFSIALVQVRGALQGKPMFNKSALRIGEVMLVATLVNAAWFPIFHEAKWWFRLDILHCIVVSLSAVLITLTATKRVPRAVTPVLALIALVVFFVSPLLENASPNIAWLVSEKSGSLFPIFPWAGYAFLGATVGAAAAHSEREMHRVLGVLFVVGAVVWALSGPLEHAYPPHRFWVTNPANCADRLTKVLVLVAGFRWLELKRPAFATGRVASFLTTFGTSSLAAYFFHEMLLFYPTLRLFSFNMYFTGQEHWLSWFAVLLGVWAATYGCIVVWNRIDPRLRGGAKAVVARLRK